MDGIDYTIIGLLALVAIMAPVGIIVSGQAYEEWETTIDVMNCDSLKEHFVEEEQLSGSQESELMKRIIKMDCI